MTNQETDVETKKSIFTIQSHSYDVLKLVVMFGLPFVSVLYFVFGTIFDFSNIDVVLGVLAFTTFLLSMFLKKTNDLYKKSDTKYDGDIVITENGEGQKMYSLELNGHPSLLNNKSEVSFRIKPVA